MDVLGEGQTERVPQQYEMDVFCLGISGGSGIIRCWLYTTCSIHNPHRCCTGSFQLGSVVGANVLGGLSGQIFQSIWKDR